MFWQCGGEQLEVVHVAGQDRFAAAGGHDNEVGVDDVAGTGVRQQVSDFGSVIEADNDDCLQESREACLPGTITPHLRHNWVCRREWRLVDERGGEKHLRRVFTSIDGDEESGVKNQGRNGRSSTRFHLREPGRPRVPSRRADPREPRAVVSRRRAGGAPHEVHLSGRHGTRPTCRAFAPRRGRAGP